MKLFEKFVGFDTLKKYRKSIKKLFEKFIGLSVKQVAIL